VSNEEYHNNITRITLLANVDQNNFNSSGWYSSRSFFIGKHALRNAYVDNVRKAGTYVWTGRIWRVE
jgi:hypothetical protein